MSTNDIPKPGSWRKLVPSEPDGKTIEVVEATEKTKPLYIRKPHLMVKPFKGLGEALEGLGKATEGLGESLGRIGKIPDNKYPTPKGRRRTTKEKK